MNCPVRTDPLPDEGHNQNPPSLAAELTTNNSLNHRANQVHNGCARSDLEPACHDDIDHTIATIEPDQPPDKHHAQEKEEELLSESTAGIATDRRGPGAGPKAWARKVKETLWKYSKFIGPGFMVSVAYIDPGNYATDVAAGASYRFKLLFMVFVSNMFAIFLQSLCVKLGTVTGMNLAENCKAHLPRWLNYALYVLAEAAIIATDIAEVIGTAIALNLLLHVPLVAGCAISIVDVMFILFFYNPTGMSMRALRFFEFFVMLLVIGVVVCFCFELSLIKGTPIGEVFRGYLPSSAIVKSQGLYQSCGILGATVMPHSLYLGSGIVQARLRDFDMRNRTPSNQVLRTAQEDSARSLAHSPTVTDGELVEEEKWRPSLAAIKSCLTFSIVELALSLFFFATFVNSAILIVAGSSLSEQPSSQTSNSSLFGIHNLLSKTLAPAAGTIFALGLLLSGTSAGIICTIAGQMVSEGQLNWTVKPWVRRLFTRSISITPSIIIAGAVGQSGLDAALVGSQVALSIILPFVSAPLIWFTCRSAVMSVWTEDQPAALETERKKGQTQSEHCEERCTDSEQRAGAAAGGRFVVMRNSWLTTAFALFIWLVIAVMNVALLVLLGLGKN